MSDNIENSELEENIEETIELEEETPIPEIDSKYRMILLAAQRSKQLQRGATPKIVVDVRKSKSTRIAMEEIKQKTVRFKILEQE
jgi:DNA-directed RNA polymerase subunit omega